MRAVVAHGAGDFRLEAVPEPEVGGGAVIRVEASGVCAADRSIFRGTSPWQLSFPFVPGHEFVGTIVELDGEAAARWSVAVGDRVTAEVIVPCDSCRFCVSGRYHLCRNGRHLGSGLPGGWAEYMQLPPRARVWQLPQTLEPWRAVLAEPLSCGLYAAGRAEIAASDRVAVAGIGAIGAGVIAGAAAASPEQLIALATSPERCEVARQLGAHQAIDVRSEDVAARIAELTEGWGLDVYIDASGALESLQRGLALLAPGGRLVVYGVYPPGGDRIDWNLVAEFKELEVRGGHLSPGAFPAAIELLERGQIDASLIVTHREPLERFREAIEPSDRRPRLKAVMEPGAGDPALVTATASNKEGSR